MSETAPTPAELLAAIERADEARVIAMMAFLVEDEDRANLEAIHSDDPGTWSPATLAAITAARAKTKPVEDVAAALQRELGVLIKAAEARWGEFDEGQRVRIEAIDDRELFLRRVWDRLVGVGDDAHPGSAPPPPTQ